MACRADLAALTWRDTGDMDVEDVEDVEDAGE